MSEQDPSATTTLADTSLPSIDEGDPAAAAAAAGAAAADPSLHTPDAAPAAADDVAGDGWVADAAVTSASAEVTLAVVDADAAAAEPSLHTTADAIAAAEVDAGAAAAAADAAAVAAIAEHRRLPVAEDFQEGDAVEFIKGRENPMNHRESYKVGERGFITSLRPGSSVVEVDLQGNYEIVESVLPLVKRSVPGRKVWASLLSVRKLPPAEVQSGDQTTTMQRALALPAPADVPTPLLDVEETWLRATFDFCHPTPDEKTPQISKKELLRACTNHDDVAAFLGAVPDDFSMLEVAFQNVAGRSQDWINFTQLEKLYRKLLGWRSRSNEMPCGEDPSSSSLTSVELSALSEVYEDAARKSMGSGVAAIDLRASCEACPHGQILFGSRRLLREMTLNAVCEHVLDALTTRMLGAVEDDPVRLGFLEDGISALDWRSLCDDDESWWKEILVAFHATQHPEDKLAREGDFITKGFLSAYLRENPQSALLFFFRRRRQLLPLQDAIGRSLAQVALAMFGCGSDLPSERISWETFLAAYQSGLA